MKLEIDGTDRTPTVGFNVAENVFILKGKSYPENAFDFYEPIIKWLQTNLSETNITANFDVALDYLNSSSVMAMKKVFQVLGDINNSSSITVRWHYVEEDHDHLEEGKELAEIVSVPFEFVPVPS